MSETSKEEVNGAIRFLEKISIPRHTKSNNAEKVERIIVEDFKKISKDLEKKGISSKVETQDFTLSDWFIGGVINVVHPISGALMVTIFGLYLGNLYVPALILNVVLCIYSFFSRQIISFLQFRIHKLGKQHPSSNVILQICPEEKSEQNIIYLAHRDSISHKIAPLPEGIGFFIGYVIAFIYSLHLFIVIIPCLDGICDPASPWKLVWGLIFAIFTFIELFNSKGNQSIGVIDNGTGVAAMHYLAKRIEQTPLKKTNVFFVATGAEELGDHGAYYYLEKFAPSLPKDKTKFLVIDSVGTKTRNVITYGIGIPVRHYSESLEKEARKVNQKMGNPINFQTFPPLLQVGTDHFPIDQKGYECLVFHCETFTIFHGPKDNWDAFDEESYRTFLKFSEKFLRRLDEQINI